MKTFEIGDNIYRYDYGRDVLCYSVTRVTEKTAWCGKIKIPRVVDETFSFKEIGNNNYYYVETPFLKEKFRRQTVLSNVKSFIRDKSESLTTDQLERIKIILELKNES